MDKIDSFFKSIAIEKKDIDKAKFYIKLRGLQDHIFIKEFLEAHNIKPSYYMIASIFRYDKRIRRILFKYIGLIEEYLRAYLINKGDHETYNNITNSLFSKLLNNKEIAKYLDANGNEKFFNQNKNALIYLRNIVMHSNLLITNKNLKKCKVANKIESYSLLDNIVNVLYFLPNKDFMLSFIEEINLASKMKRNQNEMQVRWNLPSFIILKIDKNALNYFNNINRI